MQKIAKFGVVDGSVCVCVSLVSAVQFCFSFGYFSECVQYATCTHAVQCASISWIHMFLKLNLSSHVVH